MAHFVIIGGGIGGLAAAACLQARGIQAQVYERAGELREIGAAISVWPNSTRVFQRLNLLDALIARSHVPPAGALRDWRGRILMKVVNFEGSTPALFTHRADVHAILRAAVEPERLHFGKAFTGLERADAKVRALFADGTTSEWADGLIGADGIRSAVRETTLADGPAIYRGYVAWRGVATFDAGDQFVGESWGRGMRFGCIPLGRGRVGWWATSNYNPRRLAEVLAMPAAEWKKDLLRRFGSAHKPIPDLIAATTEDLLLCNPLNDRPLSAIRRPWGDGPVTLLGDAAHPSTPNLGQGGCMAIEDAAVLSHAMAAIPKVATAFRVYEMTRRERTARIVLESRRMGAAGQWQNPIACAIRNWLAQHAPTGGLKKQIISLWDYDAWETPLIMRG